jgi:amylo-alpha-1,6-glucosidase
MQITPGQRVTLVLSAESDLQKGFGEPQHEEAVMKAHTLHQRRIKQLLDIADRSTDNLSSREPVLARLVVAADQFIVARPQPASKTSDSPAPQISPDRKTVIVGYPWFTDWGRDSMISLPGLLLCTGRYSEARGLLKAFVSFTQEGLIPNRFPDSGEAPEYITVDATLWMFHALHCYITVGITIILPVLTHKFASSLSLMRTFVLRFSDAYLGSRTRLVIRNRTRSDWELKMVALVITNSLEGDARARGFLECMSASPNGSMSQQMRHHLVFGPRMGYA